MRKNTATMDLETGELKMGDIIVKPGMKISDFKPYGDALHFADMGNGRAIFRMRELVWSNGVVGEVKITVDDKDGEIEVNIFPGIGEEKGLLDASKKWLLGIMDRCSFDTYDDNEASASFPWGYISAMYMSNKDYDKYGGDIEIVYHG